VSLKDKYDRPKPNQVPPRKKGNSEVVSKLVNNKTVNTEIQVDVNVDRNIKKATFELDTNLHKKLRTFAALNDTTMVDVVEKALNEYLDKMDN
jgi:hypothetical protein